MYFFSISEWHFHKILIFEFARIHTKTSKAKQAICIASLQIQSCQHDAEWKLACKDNTTFSTRVHQNSTLLRGFIEFYESTKQGYGQN
jgi:hypothetical protein